MKLFHRFCICIDDRIYKLTMNLGAKIKWFLQRNEDANTVVCDLIFCEILSVGAVNLNLSRISAAGEAYKA